MSIGEKQGGHRNIDPYHGINSLDITTGLITNKHSKVQPGTIVYFTFAENRLVTVNTSGKITSSFTHPINDSNNLNFYRPCKPDQGGFICTLSDKSDLKNKRSIGLVDSKGNVVWSTTPLPLSHDFHKVDDNQIFSIIRENEKMSSDQNIDISNNVIVEMDKTGKILWRWSVIEHLSNFNKSSQELAKIAAAKNGNPFHINSIQYVNSDFVNTIFNEPVIVLSSRTMDLTFFVGYKSGKVVYELEGLTKGQHNAQIIEPNLQGENHLLIFDNQNNHLNRIPYGNSRVIEVDIIEKKIIWSYEAKSSQPIFFTPIVGSAQRLNNGNTLICQGYYGRIFEIDAQGNIVWDFINPFINTNSNYEEQGPREIFTASKF